MLTEPLPTTLDVRKAAARGAQVSGEIQARTLPRFQPLLVGDDGKINVDLSFSKDEEHRHLVQVDLVADVQVECQRCLEPMSQHIVSSNILAVVWTDEQAAQLPRHLEPLIVEGTSCDLHEMVEDELILARPPFSYHDTSHCKSKKQVFADPDAVVEPEEDKPNPFDVLAQLKPGKNI